MKVAEIVVGLAVMVEGTVVVQPVKHFGEMAWRCFVSPPFSLVFFTTSRSICFVLCFLLSSEDSSEDSTHSALLFFIRGLVCAFVIFWLDFQSLS